MVKPKQPSIPQPKAIRKPPIGLRELDRFSHASINKWNEISRDLDELEAAMHFSLEPERRRLREELIFALQKNQSKHIVITKWVRIVDYQFSLMPLSSAGSLKGIGGRFNPGMDLDEGTLKPWPAFYLAENYETAFREKFQLKSTDFVDGLKPQELALENGHSHTVFFLQGKIENVFDMTTPSHLDEVAKVLKKIKMPDRAKALMKKLGMNSSTYVMVRNGLELYDAVLRHNWRIQPMQFGLPSRSQVLAELIRAAGFEAILYKSTMSTGKCLAIFPDKLSGATHVELVDQAPAEVLHKRLDLSTSNELAGWHLMPKSYL